MNRPTMSPRELLVFHVQELERVEDLKRQAAECVKESYQAAASAGFDKDTLKVVLKLRRMTSDQRRERRALEAIYMAALGMLDGEALPDDARRRLDPPPAPRREPDATPEADRRDEDEETTVAPAAPPETPAPAQPPLILKTPDEARQEGMDAASAGKRIYDNPYPAGDPCRAAWDEGWCAQSKSHGMDTPTAFQRRSSKAPDKDEKSEQPGKPGGTDNPDQEAA